MTWVKICGTTNLEDALTAVDAGADALGFVFYEKSPRNIDVETAREIVAKLPARVEKVGVFVGESADQWLRVVLRVGLTSVQRYPGSEPGVQPKNATATGGDGFPVSPKLYVALPVARFFEEEEKVKGLAVDFAKWKKSLRREFSLPEGRLPTIVLDSGDLRQPGGTGKTFDWNKAVPIAEGMRQGGVKLIVAGGLTPGNVADAIGVLKPWGVDVASGVEAMPGKKDREKVRAFVRAVRETDGKAR
jgi:phosphoribosylanthranilate isomerase